MALSRSVTDRRYYEKRKDELLGILGRECVKCGSTSDIEFDHVDPSTKSFTVMQKWNFPMEVLISEIAKCQPLCSKCHKEKPLRTTELGTGVVSRENATVTATCAARRRMNIHAIKGIPVKFHQSLDCPH